MILVKLLRIIFAVIKIRRRKVVYKSSLSNVKTSDGSANDPLSGRSVNSLKACVVNTDVLATRKRNTRMHLVNGT